MEIDWIRIYTNKNYVQTDAEKSGLISYLFNAISFNQLSIVIVLYAEDIKFGRRWHFRHLQSVLCRNGIAGADEMVNLWKLNRWLSYLC